MEYIVAVANVEPALGRPDAVRSRRAVSLASGLIYALGLAYVVCVLYLGVLALYPSVRTSGPAWMTWFGEPGSALSILGVLVLPTLMFAFSPLAGRRPFTSAPVLVLAAMAASAVVLGLCSYLFHYGEQTPFFAPLAWTLGLFVGNDDTHLGDSVPVALELARLLAIATTLTTALAATLALFRSQLDRVAIWRARSLIVIVGVDDETVSLVNAIAQRRSSKETLVVVTGNADQPAVAAARDLGARIRITSIQSASALVGLRMWKRLGRLYLLSEDPVQNEMRLSAVNTALDNLGDNRFRIPLTVRVDDPWQAEVWRRSFFEAREAVDSPEGENKRWVADAVGRFEISAAKLARHLTTKRVRVQAERPAKTVLVCGLTPLTHALTSEFAQLVREHGVYAKPHVDLPSALIIVARGADGFVRDHQIRQARIAPGETALPVEAYDAEGTPETVNEILAGNDPADYAVVLADSAFTTTGTRLAASFPTLRIYQASSSTAALPESTIVGRLYPFPINMDLNGTAPQDVWERAAELIHEYYSAATNRDTWSTMEWANLDPFLQQSNRRQVVNTLWLVEKVGQHTWNTIEHLDSTASSNSLDGVDLDERFEALGFDLRTVDKMIQLEHDDWCRFYRDAGWKFSTTRNDKAKRHNLLRDWDELMGSDANDIDKRENLSRARRSLYSTLLILRSLGYRSIPKGWRTYRRLGEVRAHVLEQPTSWQTSSGETMNAAAGDWLVTDEEGNVWSVKPDIFAAAHEKISDSHYRRTGTRKARKAVAGERIATLEGDLEARAGDWILEGAGGEQWSVPNTRFLTSYELVHPTDT